MLLCPPDPVFEISFPVGGGIISIRGRSRGRLVTTKGKGICGLIRLFGEEEG